MNDYLCSQFPTSVTFSEFEEILKAYNLPFHQLFLSLFKCHIKFGSTEDVTTMSEMSACVGYIFSQFITDDVSEPLLRAMTSLAFRPFTGCAHFFMDAEIFSPPYFEFLKGYGIVVPIRPFLERMTSDEYEAVKYYYPELVAQEVGSRCDQPPPHQSSSTEEAFGSTLPLDHGIEMAGSSAQERTEQAPSQNLIVHEGYKVDSVATNPVVGDEKCVDPSSRHHSTEEDRSQQPEPSPIPSDCGITSTAGDSGIAFMCCVHPHGCQHSWRSGDYFQCISSGKTRPRSRVCRQSPVAERLFTRQRWLSVLPVNRPDRGVAVTMDSAWHGRKRRKRRPPLMQY